MLDSIVDAYAEVYSNLKVHAAGFPGPEYLKSISVMGQKGCRMRDVGTDKDTSVKAGIEIPKNSEGKTEKSFLIKLFF